ncbi:MAG: hypothetical protein ACTSWN_13265 [Promethearchaeota archaeon]
MGNDNEKVKTIEIPESLYLRVQKRLANTEFKTVSEYIANLVREVLNTIEEEENKKKAFTEKEEKEIEERLRNLGYID